MALDLDGGGISTIGTGATGTASVQRVLFDHDGDGVKTATGWLAPNDGWLVRDLNGNGVIDNGGELFGVDTVTRVFNGQQFTAPDGIFALAKAGIASINLNATNASLITMRRTNFSAQITH